MTTRNVAAGIVVSLLITSCSAQQPDEPVQRRPQQAGQPLDPVETAGHMAAMRGASLTGDQEGTRRHLDAMHQDLMRSMKLADARRPIDREAARSVARDLPGVRSANWIDRHNLLVRVDGAAMRSQQTIDDLCIQLEPLGDTLAVVVHLQDAAAKTHDDMDTLSRNCQLAPGDQALFQRERTVDALDPAVRAQHRAEAERLRGSKTQAGSAGDRAAIEAIREM
ncbi:MAG: hypothetical protein RR969_02045 [Thermomonas sp.]